MSQVKDEGPHRDARILTRAIETVLRRLSRLLIGRISLVKLQEMLRRVFVEEAIEKLGADKREEKPPLAELALTTGLDTRTLKKLSLNLQTENTRPGKDRFIREITPECSLLDYWSSNPDYLERNGKTPLVLRQTGPKPSFESLMNEALSSRGLSRKFLLNRLVTAKSVQIDEEDKSVKMLDVWYRIFESENHAAALEIGMVAVSHLLETLIHNLSVSKSPTESFYQRSSWTNRLDLNSREALQSRIKQHLIKADSEAREILAEFEQEKPTYEQTSAGVSMFYFEETTPDTS